MQIVIGKDNLKPEEIVALWDVSGWGKASDYKTERMQKAIDNTQILIQARIDNRLIGLLRGFSDGVFVTHISELLVHPAFRAQGVGTALMNTLKTGFQSTNIYIEAFIENQGFFERFGLKTRPILKPMTASAIEWYKPNQHSGN